LFLNRDLTRVYELVHLDHLRALLFQGQSFPVNIKFGSKEDAYNDVLLIVTGDIEFVVKGLVVEAADTGLDVDILVRFVGADEKRVEVKLEVFKVGAESIDLNAFDLDASHEELFALVGRKVFLEVQEELVQVLVQREEGRITCGSLVVSKNTRSGL
jgi:hypothetical protein